MAKTLFDTVIGRGQSEWKALPEELEIHPELNGRHELPDIQWLIDSILSVGQIQPVLIRRSEGKPVLVAGYSRWRAVSEINKRCLTPEPLTLRCSYTQLNEQQAFIANIEENRVRNQTTPIDDAYNIQRLINVYQFSEEKVAETFHATKGWVTGRLRLLELTPEAEKAVRSGRVAGPAVKAIAKLSREHQKAVLAKPGKITAADVKREAPAPAPVKAAPKGNIKAALAALFADCDQQPDVMVFEIHKDIISALRAAVNG
jgi:ParB/RepB/Spo0J family partition protein